MSVAKDTMGKYSLEKKSIPVGTIHSRMEGWSFGRLGVEQCKRSYIMVCILGFKLPFIGQSNT
jgi:hypothetical protein